MAHSLCHRDPVTDLGSKTFLPAFGRRLLIALWEMEGRKLPPTVRYQFKTVTVLTTSITEQGSDQFCKHFGFQILSAGECHQRSVADTQDEYESNRGVHGVVNRPIEKAGGKKEDKGTRCQKTLGLLTAKVYFQRDSATFCSSGADWNESGRRVRVAQCHCLNANALA